MKSEILSILRNGILRVTFAKKTADYWREMFCTLDFDRIPKEQHPKSSATNYTNEEVVRVLTSISKNGDLFDLIL